MEEMLDPEGLREVFVVRSTANNAEQPNEALVVTTLTGALRAVADLAKKRPEMDLARLRERVAELEKSNNATLRTEAGNALRAMDDR